ncbi:TIGR04282 family arsenosugar biosynthesis glycosyltransferase [Bryobacter aggregatus]|uniref:TIGR04282 family arsenosugar biosynthesis glycosyltransferase n=1 Tax=Bryobacter aggregatus TaxID=360054 RepID=UPI0004E0E5E5|nr:DUF2064 domain-containing protein [Bryobacter aggregatus]
MFPVILLFAKAPVPGQVKTGLQPVLTPAESAELHLSFVADVLDWLKGYNSLADIELHTDLISDAWRDYPYRRVLMGEGDLGERIFDAVSAAMTEGRKQVIVLSSDSPNLPPAYLQELLESPADLAIGPTEDGSFYALSLRKLPPFLLNTVDWTRSDLTQQLTEAAQRCHCSVEIGREWFSVNSPADLVRLVTHPTPPRTTEFLKRHHFLIPSNRGTI